LRGKQKSILTGVIYDKETDPALGELLKELDNAKEFLDPIQRAVVRDSLKSFIRSTALPKELVVRQAELETEVIM
jgi:carboxypeptidase Taq